MKRQWETEELIEQSTLMPSELARLPNEMTNATAHNRVGFAVRLKFLQVEGRFLQRAGEVQRWKPPLKAIALVIFNAAPMDRTQPEEKAERGFLISVDSFLLPAQSPANRY